MPDIFEILTSRPIKTEIVKNEVSYHLAEVEINHLNFWKNNPRVYSRIRELEEDGTKDVNKESIYDTLRKTKAFKELHAEIKGPNEEYHSIVEPLWVGKEQGSDEYVVYEGNTRLAVAMLLFRNHQTKYGKVTVNLYDDSTPFEAIRNHVIQFHIKGKKKWDSFEAHGMFYREVKTKRDEHGMNKNDAIKLVADENAMSEGEIKKSYALIEFMEEKHNMSILHQKNYISYVKEILKPMHSKVRTFFNNPGNIEMGALEEAKEDGFDKMLLKKITSGDGVKRVSAAGEDGAFRDHLTLISKGYKKNGPNEHIYKLMSGEISIPVAANIAEDSGAGDKDFKNIEDFASLINDRQTKVKIMSARKNFPEIDSLLLDIKKAIQEIRLNFKAIKEKKERLKRKK